MTTDRYTPPRSPLEAVDQVVPAEPCPFCVADGAKKVRFTWWGGALGPRLFSVVRCLHCGRTFNGKRGTSLTRVTVVYQLVGVALAAALISLFIFALF